MKFLCLACDVAMESVGGTDPAGADSIRVIFRCPRCEGRVALLANSQETRLARSAGLTIGKRSNPSLPPRSAPVTPAELKPPRAGDAAERLRYTSIYIPFDNSAHALGAVELGVAIASKSNACVTASHVYAARLHDRRFREMEADLPVRYREQGKVADQREVHENLISRGLGMISDRYLAVPGTRCAEANVACRRVALEGKNWRRLVDDILSSDCDLVVMGALGLGAVATSIVGSVCERVARRIDRDLLVVKAVGSERRGAIVVGIDGSPQSYGALKAGLELARIFERPLEAVAVYDPFFHQVAFRSIATVLSADAASVFRFREQEALHEEIIDAGLAKIYQGHLAAAAELAAAEGATLRTMLLAGKAFDQILNYARNQESWLLALGRVGIHSDAAMDLGSTTENLLRAAPCNVLLAGRTFEPPAEPVAEANIVWTREAELRIERVPEFARDVARRAVRIYATAQGHSVVTSDVIDGCLAAMAQEQGPQGGQAAARGCPFARRGRTPGRTGDPGQT